MEKVNRGAEKLIIQAIKQQIRQNDPPEMTETFDRLRREGHAGKGSHLVFCPLDSPASATRRSSGSSRWSPRRCCTNPRLRDGGTCTASLELSRTSPGRTSAVTALGNRAPVVASQIAYPVSGSLRVDVRRRE